MLTDGIISGMPDFRRTKTAGVFVRHQLRCPAADHEAARCRCTPSYRGRRRNPVTGKPEWSRTLAARAEVMSWLGGTEHAKAIGTRSGKTLVVLGDEWIAGVESGAIAKRRGRAGSSYTPTTLAGYVRSWQNLIRPEFGALVAGEIHEHEWQAWTDRLARQGLSRSRIANHVAVVSAIYAWASRPTRRALTGVDRNPMLAVELPANDEKPRLRVALPAEAAQLLDVLAANDRVPYAIAAYAGMRRAEIHRLDWQDVELDERRITVRVSKSDAGTMRRVPIAKPLVPILLRAYLAAGKPTTGRVLEVSVMSGKIAERAMRAWGWRTDDDIARDNAQRAQQGLRRFPAPTVTYQAENADRVWHGWGAEQTPITLHGFRHTYASLLMASGYTIKEMQTYLGHASLVMTDRYVKLLPQPAEENAADRLDAYLAASTKGSR